MFTAVQQLGQ